MTETQKTDRADLDTARVRAVGVLKANALAWVAVLALVGGGLYYQDQRDQDRQREICGLITITDDTYRRTPPSGPGGKAFAQAVHDYRLRIGCTNTPLPDPVHT